MDNRKEDNVIRKWVTQTNRKNISDRMLDLRTVIFCAPRPSVTEDSRRVAGERDCWDVGGEKRLGNKQFQAQQLPALKLKISAFSHSALTSFLLFW
jgi:hypothetical protein